MYNILICDDQPDIVNALKIYLAPEGYALFEAFNGQEALEILQQKEIHLIILDVMMPVMDGITATARRCRARTATTRAISSSRLIRRCSAILRISARA